MDVPRELHAEERERAISGGKIFTATRAGRGGRATGNGLPSSSPPLLLPLPLVKDEIKLLQRGVRARLRTFSRSDYIAGRFFTRARVTSVEQSDRLSGDATRRDVPCTGEKFSSKTLLFCDALSRVLSPFRTIPREPRETSRDSFYLR